MYSCACTRVLTRLPVPCQLPHAQVSAAVSSPIGLYERSIPPGEPRPHAGPARPATAFVSPFQHATAGTTSCTRPSPAHLCTCIAHQCKCKCMRAACVISCPRKSKQDESLTHTQHTRKHTNTRTHKHTNTHRKHSLRITHTRTHARTHAHMHALTHSLANPAIHLHTARNFRWITSAALSALTRRLARDPRWARWRTTAAPSCLAFHLAWHATAQRCSWRVHRLRLAWQCIHNMIYVIWQAGRHDITGCGI
jgi:hypothetical protein